MKNWKAGQTYEIECGFWLETGRHRLIFNGSYLSNFYVIINGLEQQVSSNIWHLSETSFIDKIRVIIPKDFDSEVAMLELGTIGKMGTIGKVYNHQISERQELNELATLWLENEGTEELLTTLYSLTNAAGLRLYPDYNLSAAAIPIKIVGENLKNGDKISIADMWCVLDENCNKCCWDTDTGAVYDLERMKIIKNHGRLNGVVKVSDSLQPTLQKKSENTEGKISLQYQLRYY